MTRPPEPHGQPTGAGLNTSATQPLSAQVAPPPSLAGSSRALPGMTALTADPQVALGIASREAQSTSVALTSATMMSGAIERQFRQIRSHVDSIGAVLRDAADQLDQAGEGRRRSLLRTGHPPSIPHASPSRVAGHVPPGHTGHPHAEPRPGVPLLIPRPGHPEDTVMRTTTEMAGEEPEGGAETNQIFRPPGITSLSFSAGREAFSIGEVRRRAASAAARTLQPQVAQYELRDGQWYRTGTGRHRRYGPMASGAISARANALRGLSSVAEGTTLTEAFPGLGRVAGPAGFATAAALEGARFLQSQRQANQVYQQITGGPNFSLTDPESGFRQRVSENVFGWSQLGTMGAKQARDLFRGVTELGVPGGVRQDALDFATAQFRRTGMSVAQSLDLISRTVENGVSTFDGLNRALDKVSATARLAGANVNVAQQAFGRTLGAVQQDVTGTAAAPTIAAALQSELTRQGHTLAGQLDFTGMLSQPAMMMQAAALRQNPMAYMASVQENPPMMGRGLQAQVDRIRDAVFTPQALQWAHDRASESVRATGGQLTPAVAADIGRAMAERGMLNVLQFMQVAAGLGLGGITPANVYEVAAKVALGGFRFDRALSAESIGLPDAGRTVGGRQIVTDSQVAAARAARSGPGSPTGVGTQSGQLGQLAEAIAQPFRAIQTGKGGQQRTGGPDAAGRAYITGVQQTGVRSEILESLLRDEHTFGGRHYVVQGPRGPVSVTFEQALQRYQDQLRRGDVTIQETGETVAQATGHLGATRTQVTSSGQPVPAGAKEPEQVVGAVTIYATDELRRILGFRQGGYIDSAQRSGVPAAAFPLAPAEYPSATGRR